METLFFNIAITAFAYLFIPAILCLSKQRFSLSKIKKIVIINGICIWLIFTVININLGGDGFSAAVFLWSAVAYCMLKKICLIHSDDTTNTEICTVNQDNTLTTTTPIETKNIQSSHNSPYKKWKYNSQTILNIILSSLLIISFIFNIYLYITKDNNIKYITTDKYEKYFTYWQNTHDKLEFMDDNIVFIEDDGTDQYHKYDCYKFVGNNYWAHNIEYAEYIGYSPCPICYN